ncbi:aldehyde dehydrogenase family protein [Petroclostridium sp. X23]|uniref:aldehyde dehydrogenase family protein n=1 Tax=Petroclostridium sp. X23 TaxID=3045146 RepID=UPI0024ACB930|nr:aldehyde dehydrogenase family protein [Petroclostridium sp. X23]WHH57021.1 aldehyde dehydrogenase family protein [Petroclostridium sp. X23]
MDSKEYVKSLIAKAKIAQQKYEQFNQAEVDVVVREIAKVVFDNAVELARMAADETRMGVFEDKIKKNQGKAKILWHSLKPKKSVGIINRNEETGIVEIAKPVGVVGAVTPCTNPIVTPMCNAMFALKGRNAIIIAPHPRAKRCGKYTVELFNKALEKYNVPENLIQIIEEPSVELTNELMKAVDVVVATGGMGMVKAAYSSGKPAYGVGAGNVQCIVDRDVELKEAVPKIIAGRIFDNGIICSGEQTVIAPEEDYDKIIEEFKMNGAYYIDDKDEKEALRKVLFVDGIMNKDVVGQSVQKIAEMANLDIPKDTKVILVEADGIGTEDILCKEKMCPVIAAFRYKEFSEAVSIAQANLDVEGKGHSVCIHSNNTANIEYAGVNLTISRLLVNQICATSNGGSFFNGLAPTTTLGCGSWGNNSVSENVDYKHFINVSRIGYFIKDAKVPGDEELWGE